MIAWGSQALAALTITSADWNGRRLEVEGTDGRGGAVNVYYGYAPLQDANRLGIATVKGNGKWELKVNSSRRNPLDPVPCAVSATLAGDPSVMNFPVTGAPDNCAPQPPGGNTPPVANDDTATTDQDVPVTIDVLANDTAPDSGDVLNVASVTQGTDGAPTNVGGKPDSTDRILAAVAHWNALRRVTVHAIGIGGDLNQRFLAELAEQNGGISRTL